MEICEESLFALNFVRTLKSPSQKMRKKLFYKSRRKQSVPY